VHLPGDYPDNCVNIDNNIFTISCNSRGSCHI
jgi:hypothetical protein